MQRLKIQNFGELHPSKHMAMNRHVRPTVFSTGRRTGVVNVVQREHIFLSYRPHLITPSPLLIFTSLKKTLTLKQYSLTFFFFNFYITLTIFYYYLNKKKTYYNTNFFYFFI
jgi:hypothetical protein